MRKYKKWSPEDRKRSLALTNKAKKLGLIGQPKKCNRCGQTEGILHQHNEDYDFTLNTLPKVFSLEIALTVELKKKIANCLEPICWRCHMIHHSSHRSPEACEYYWEQIKAGHKFPPVFKTDFSILKRDHGIS